MIIMGSKRKVHDILGPLEEKPKEDSGGDALESVFEELMEAVKSGDAKAGVSALRAFISECKASETSEE